MITEKIIRSAGGGFLRLADFIKRHRIRIKGYTLWAWAVGILLKIEEFTDWWSEQPRKWRMQKVRRMGFYVFMTVLSVLDVYSLILIFYAIG